MKVSGLYIHPVKSLAGISVSETPIDRFGAQWDRRWMVVDERGQFITQRKIAKMAQVETFIDNGVLQLCAPSMPSVQLRADDFIHNQMIDVTVWRDTVKAHLADEAINQWVSQALGLNCRLVFMSDQCKRQVDTAYANNNETVSFADGFPLLLTNQASLDFLNQQMSIDITMNRFRPNVVVGGAEAWQEDNWQRIRIGEMEFQVAKPCSRCVIPTINPQTLEKQPEVFRTLKQYRSRDGEVFFGQNLIPLGEGCLSLNAPVEVL